MDKNKLEKLLRAFVEESLNRIDKEKVPKIKTRVLTGFEDRPPVWQIDGRKAIDVYLRRRRYIVETDEAESLLEYIEDVSDLDLDERYLISILIDVLGKEGGNLDCWKEKLDRAIDKIEKDSQRRHREISKHFLEGLAIKDRIKIECPFQRCISLEFDSLGDGKILDEQRIETGLTGFSSQRDISFVESIMNIEVERHSDMAINELNSSFQNFTLNCLRLYGACNVHSRMHKIEPKTFHGEGNKGYPLEFRSHSPECIIKESDKDSIENLLQLLSNSYLVRDREFSHTQLDLAISHFDTSMKKSKNSIESVTFAIIGIESIYKHCATGDAYPKTYAGFLLGNAVSSWDPGEIQNDIENAYETRHSVVHGEQDDRDNELREKMWDYLRVSIVLFAWLRENYTQGGEMPLNEALIDENERKNLRECLENFELKDYLKLDGQG